MRLLLPSAVLAFCLGAAPAEADGPQAAPPVEELVATALDFSPVVRAARERLVAARQEVGPASVLPDPVLELSLTGMGLAPPHERSWGMFEFRQGIPFPGKRGARGGSARAAVAVSQADLDRTVLELARQVRQAYAGLYAIDAGRRGLAEAAMAIEMLSASVAARYATGGTPLDAPDEIALRRAALAERLIGLERDRARLTAELGALLGRNGPYDPGEVASLPEPAGPPSRTLDERPTPSERVFMGEVEHAGAVEEEARLASRPDFMIGAGAGLDGTPDPMVRLMLGLELPLWNASKQAPLQRAAARRLAAARHELAQAGAEAASDRESIIARWVAADRLVALYRKTLLPRTGSAGAAARSAWESGRGDFEPVVEGLIRLAEARESLARHEAERYAASADWQALDGSGTEGDPP